MEDVYCTMLLNDGYLPGVQVLAHSLRDGGSTKKLAIMVTVQSVSEDTLTKVKNLYDFVIPVDPIYNKNTSNLHLMNRLDLTAAFTKINLWKQIQFRKILFVDADVVALRPPDELFEVEADFAACPDIGWPDCFNSGVMLVRPDTQTYYSLLELAEQGASFDGADQGLFNMFFRDWHRLSFTYNCTPSSSYQYTPAFRHFSPQVSMVHFIGAEKPWTRGRSYQGGPADELSGQWWAVHDRHYQGGVQRGQHDSRSVPYVIKGDTYKIQSLPGKTTRAPAPTPQASSGQQHGSSSGHTAQRVFHDYALPPSSVMHFEPPIHEISSFIVDDDLESEHMTPTPGSPIQKIIQETIICPLEELEKLDINENNAPPAPSELSSPPVEPVEYHLPQRAGVTPFSGPRNPVFPWEGRTRGAATRVFADDIEDREIYEEEPSDYDEEEPRMWGGYVPQNQWDTVPGIQEYISNLSTHRQSGRGQQAGRNAQASSSRNAAASVPGTPNPTPSQSFSESTGRRQSFQYPSAEGIPSQEEWDPQAKLEELRRLPRSFILSYLADSMRSEAVQTVQDDADVSSGSHSPPSFDYSDSMTQTDGDSDDDEHRFKGLQLDTDFDIMSDSAVTMSQDGDQDELSTPTDVSMVLGGKKGLGIVDSIDAALDIGGEQERVGLRGMTV